MSANPATNDPVEVNGLPVAPPGGTVTSGTWAVSASSYEPQALARRAFNVKGKKLSKAAYGSEGQGFVGVDGFSNATTFLNDSLAVMANVNQGVILKDNAGVTSGLNGGISIPIGGTVVDASGAKRVIVTLGYNGTYNAGTATVPSRFIPGDLKRILGSKQVYNTVTLLSAGGDAYTGTTSNDLAVLGRGDDRAVMGFGDDTVYLNTRMNRKEVNLDQGRDKVVINEDALESGGSLRIWDFDHKKDMLFLDARKRDVKGVGTKVLTVSTGRKKVVITSDASAFSRSSIEFI